MMYQMDDTLRQHLHKCDASLQKHLRQARPDEEIDILIQRKNDLEPAACDALHQYVQDCGATIVAELPIIDALAARIPVRILPQIASHAHVHRVHLDRTMHALLDVAAPTIGSSQEWRNGLTGKNVTIAILDTGIYPHPDLTTPTNRIIAFHDVMQGRSDPYDDNGHGTHVAGCAAGGGTTSNGEYRGPAFEASLVGVKVLDAKGQGSISKIIAGVQWCIQQKDTWGIRILSLSLGGPASESYRQDPLCQALEKAWQAGLVVCVAAGNEGPGENTISSPGIDPVLITVGATDDKRTINEADDSVASFSSRGPTIDGLSKPDIVAPGVNIISLRAPGSTLDRFYPQRRVGENYFALSGTSMATPICAGAAALLIEAKPDATPDQIKSALLAGAKDLFQNPNTAGRGYVDLPGAVNALGAGGTPPKQCRTAVTFTPDFAPMICKEIASAQTELAIEAASITDLDIVTALANAARRGVRVRMLLDFSLPENMEVVRFLTDKGVDIQAFQSEREQVGQLHTALAIIDGSRAIFGSGRWSYQNLYGARNHAVLTDDPEVLSKILKMWEDDWQLATKQKLYSDCVI